MSCSRRTVLKGAAVVPLAAAAFAAPAMAMSRPALRIIADRSLASADALARLGARRGLPVADPEGELVHLFRGECADWLADGVPLVGITGYADYALMGDLARERGRRIVNASLGRRRLVGDGQSGDAVVRLLKRMRAEDGAGFAWRI